MEPTQIHTVITNRSRKSPHRLPSKPLSRLFTTVVELLSQLYSSIPCSPDVISLMLSLSLTKNIYLLILALRKQCLMSISWNSFLVNPKYFPVISFSFSSLISSSLLHFLSSLNCNWHLLTYISLCNMTLLDVDSNWHGAGGLGWRVWCWLPLDNRYRFGI